MRGNATSVTELRDSILGVCPVCRYSLVGLPRKHNCPECGFLYDKRACLFTRSNGAMIVYGVVSVVFVLIGMLLWWGGLPRVGAGLFVTAGLPGVVATLWRLRCRNNFVLVSLDNVRVIASREEEVVVPMRMVDSARWSSTSGGVEVLSHDGAVLTTIPPSLLQSARRSKKLAITISVFARGERHSLYSVD